MVNNEMSEDVLGEAKEVTTGYTEATSAASASNEPTPDAAKGSPEGAAKEAAEPAGGVEESIRLSPTSLFCSLPLNSDVQTIIDTFPKTEAEKSGKKTRKIPCLYCDRTFVADNLRQKHVERSHSVKQARRSSSRFQQSATTVTCLFCNKFTLSESRLNDLFEHLVTAHPTRYFGCLTCKERFALLSQLEEHNEIIHGIKREIKVQSTDEASDKKTNSAINDNSAVKTKHKAKIKEDVEPSDESRRNLRKLKHQVIQKELRSKRIAIKSTKLGIKRSARLQNKVIQGKTKKRSKPKDRAYEDQKLDKEREAKNTPNENPYPTFDAFYRVKKITDHSIDNLRISSLTFNDVFDQAFYNRIQCNIRENLLHHIDGKLFKNEESESRISNFEKAQPDFPKNTENYGCEISLNAATPIATSLITAQFGDDPELQIEYGSKASKKKSTAKQDEVHYKYFTRRKYQASILESKENRDLSKLDMWTQLVIKKRQQKIMENNKSDKEKLEYKKCEEYRAKVQNHELNRVLDRRGPFEDLKEEANKKAALEGTYNREANADVSCVLDDILTKVFSSVIFDVDIKTELTDSEIPGYLNLRKASLTNDSFVDKSDKITLICSSQETENFEAPEISPRDKNALVELTGEWARSRLYICAACGLKMANMKSLIDHKNIVHQNVWCQHYEFVGNQGAFYRHLSIPGLGKMSYVEGNSGYKVWRRSEARICTKCKKQCNSLGELHRHVLECGEDWSWMLVRKKCKYKPFGAKTRKKRRGLFKRIIQKEKTTDENREKKKYKKEGPRVKASDADTIERMLANLPAKRATRKIMCLKDGFPKIKKSNYHKQKAESSTVIPIKNRKQNMQLRRNRAELLLQESNKILKGTVLQKSGHKCNPVNNIRKSVRNLNKVISSKLIDNNSTLKVKRKLKTVIQQQRFTRRALQLQESVDAKLLVESAAEETTKNEDSAETVANKEPAQENRKINTILKRVQNLRKSVMKKKTNQPSPVDSTENSAPNDQENENIPIRKTRSTTNLSTVVESEVITETDVIKPSNTAKTSPKKRATKKSKFGSKLLRTLNLRKREKSNKEVEDNLVAQQDDTSATLDDTEDTKNNGKRKSKFDTLKDVVKKMRICKKPLQENSRSQKLSELPSLIMGGHFLEKDSESTDIKTVNSISSESETKTVENTCESVINKQSSETSVELESSNQICVLPEVTVKIDEISVNLEQTDVSINETSKVIETVEKVADFICDRQIEESSEVVIPPISEKPVVEVPSENLLENICIKVEVPDPIPEKVLIPKPKVCKRPKGLNACIAMLTSKLQQKEDKPESAPAVEDVHIQQSSPPAEKQPENIPAIQGKQESVLPTQDVQESSLPIQDKQASSPAIQDKQVSCPALQDTQTSSPEIQDKQASSLAIQDKQACSLVIQDKQVSSLAIQDKQASNPAVQDTQDNCPSLPDYLVTRLVIQDKPVVKVGIQDISPGIQNIQDSTPAVKAQECSPIREDTLFSKAAREDKIISSLTFLDKEKIVTKELDIILSQAKEDLNNLKKKHAICAKELHRNSSSGVKENTPKLVPDINIIEKVCVAEKPRKKIDEISRKVDCIDRNSKILDEQLKVVDVNKTKPSNDSINKIVHQLPQTNEVSDKLSSKVSMDVEIDGNSKQKSVEIQNNIEVDDILSELTKEIESLNKNKTSCKTPATSEILHKSKDNYDDLPINLEILSENKTVDNLVKAVEVSDHKRKKKFDKLLKVLENIDKNKKKITEAPKVIECVNEPVLSTADLVAKIEPCEKIVESSEKIPKVQTVVENNINLTELRIKQEIMDDWTMNDSYNNIAAICNNIRNDSDEFSSKADEIDAINIGNFLEISIKTEENIEENTTKAPEPPSIAQIIDSKKNKSSTLPKQLNSKNKEKVKVTEFVDQTKKKLEESINKSEIFDKYKNTSSEVSRRVQNIDRNKQISQEQPKRIEVIEPPKLTITYNEIAVEKSLEIPKCFSNGFEKPVIEEKENIELEQKSIEALIHNSPKNDELRLEKVVDIIKCFEDMNNKNINVNNKITNAAASEEVKNGLKKAHKKLYKKNGSHKKKQPKSKLKVAIAMKPIETLLPDINIEEKLNTAMIIDDHINNKLNDVQSSLDGRKIGERRTLPSRDSKVKSKVNLEIIKDKELSIETKSSSVINREVLKPDSKLAEYTNVQCTKIAISEFGKIRPINLERLTCSRKIDSLVNVLKEQINIELVDHSIAKINSEITVTPNCEVEIIKLPPPAQQPISSEINKLLERILPEVDVLPIIGPAESDLYNGIAESDEDVPPAIIITPTKHDGNNQMIPKASTPKTYTSPIKTFMIPSKTASPPKMLITPPKTIVIPSKQIEISTKPFILQPKQLDFSIKPVVLTAKYIDVAAKSIFTPKSMDTLKELSFVSTKTIVPPETVVIPHKTVPIITKTDTYSLSTVSPPNTSIFMTKTLPLKSSIVFPKVNLSTPYKTRVVDSTSIILSTNAAVPHINTSHVNATTFDTDFLSEMNVVPTKSAVATSKNIFTPSISTIAPIIDIVPPKTIESLLKTIDSEGEIDPVISKQVALKSKIRTSTKISPSKTAHSKIRDVMMTSIEAPPAVTDIFAKLPTPDDANGEISSLPQMKTNLEVESEPDILEKKSFIENTTPIKTSISSEIMKTVTKHVDDFTDSDDEVPLSMLVKLSKLKRTYSITKLSIPSENKPENETSTTAPNIISTPEVARDEMQEKYPTVTPPNFVTAALPTEPEDFLNVVIKTEDIPFEEEQEEPAPALRGRGKRRKGRRKCAKKKKVIYKKPNMYSRRLRQMELRKRMKLALTIDTIDLDPVDDSNSATEETTNDLTATINKVILLHKPAEMIGSSIEAGQSAAVGENLRDTNMARSVDDTIDTSIYKNDCDNVENAYILRRSGRIGRYDTNIDDLLNTQLMRNNANSIEECFFGKENIIESRTNSSKSKEVHNRKNSLESEEIANESVCALATDVYKETSASVNETNTSLLLPQQATPREESVDNIDGIDPIINDTISENSKENIDQLESPKRPKRKQAKAINKLVTESPDCALNEAEETPESDLNFTPLKDNKNTEFINDSSYVQTPDLDDTLLSNKINSRLKLKQISKKKKAKKMRKKDQQNTSIDNYCDICDKRFIRNNSLSKHNRTLTHIAKLSEIEAREATEKREIEDKPEEDKIVSISKDVADEQLDRTTPHEIRNTLNEDYTADITNSLLVTSPFSLKTNNDTLKLADIINDVLNKPVTGDTMDPFADLLDQKPEAKRYKSLGERKSFDSDSMMNFNPTKQNFANHMNTNIMSNKMPDSTGTFLETQISLLENIIENKSNFQYIDEISVASNKSDERCPSDMSLVSDIKQDDSNIISFSHNTDIVSSIMHSDANFVKPSQYEEISEDSLNTHNFDEQRARKALNRDEELFLECCSLLKSSSEVSDYSKKSSKAIDMVANSYGLKPGEETEWLERKSFMNKQKSFNGNDEFLSGDSCPDTPLGDNYDDFSNSNTIKTDWNSKLKDNEFEDISLDSLTNNSDNNSNFNSFNINFNEENSNTRSKSIISNEIPKQSAEGIKKNDELEKVAEEKFNQLIAEITETRIPEETKELTVSKKIKSTPEVTQMSITDYAVPLPKKIDSIDSLTNDNKKLLTKGAMKVFEGLKVSIPTEELDMSEVLNCSPTSKRLELENSDIIKDDKLDLTTKSKDTLPKFGNKLGLKITKRRNKPKKSLQDIKKSTEENKVHDIYDFEETQDNTDLFIPSNLRTFRTQLAEKKEVTEEPKIEEPIPCQPENPKDMESDLDSNNHYVDSFSVEAQSVSSFSTGTESNISAKKTSRAKNITKKKCVIMGRIFKNAFKPKPDEIKAIPSIENNKLVEKYVMSCPSVAPRKISEERLKMTEQEMDLLFDKLLEENAAFIKSKAALKQKSESKSKKSLKQKKRARKPSISSDDEFNLNKTPKKRATKKKGKDNAINLEQELKECMGVAGRKSQRKCTSGKQNVLVEVWSSDDSEFEAMLKQSIQQSTDQQQKLEKTVPLLPPPLPPPPPPPPQPLQPPQPIIAEIVSEESKDIESSIVESKLLEEPLNTDFFKEIVKDVMDAKPRVRRKSSTKSKSDKMPKMRPPTTETLATNRRKRAAADTLYYWSSSSDDDTQNLIEVKSVRDEIEEDDDRPMQHGWIVGDSPKKLVTMLAQAKGKKVDAKCVKEQSKKRTTL